MLSAVALARFLEGAPPPRPNGPTLDPESEEGARELAGRLMRPDRPNEAAVRDIARRVPRRAGGAALWEALAAHGHLPEGWLADPERAFVSGRPGVRPTGIDGLDAATARALACDPAGVQTAEELLRESFALASLFGPIGLSNDAPPSIAWRVGAGPTSAAGPPSLTSTQPWLDANKFLRDTLHLGGFFGRGQAAVRQAQDALKPRFGNLDEAYASIGHLPASNFVAVMRAFGAMEEVREGGRLPTPRATEEGARLSTPAREMLEGKVASRLRGTALEGTALADLPNPWAAIVELYRLGYAFAGQPWWPEGDLLLLCPPLND